MRVQNHGRTSTQDHGTGFGGTCDATRLVAAEAAVGGDETTPANWASKNSPTSTLMKARPASVPTDNDLIEYMFCVLGEYAAVPEFRHGEPPLPGRARVGFGTMRWVQA
jgi:hypothetical protein